MSKKIHSLKNLLLLVSIVCLGYISKAEEPENSNASEATEAKTEEPTSGQEAKSFDAGQTIVEHVADNHQWHLCADIFVPLPVIAKTDKGCETFSSAHFGHEGNEVYKGENYSYAIKEGNLVVVNEAGAIDEQVTATLWDFSITKNTMAMFVSMLLMLWIFLSVAKSYKKNPGVAPKGMQSFLEPLILFIRDDVAKVSIGEKRYQQFLPFLLTVFFFIWINNLLGLVPFLPGGANVTGSISIAMVLAAFVLLITFVIANKHYWKHVFAMPGVPFGVLFILTPIEILGLFLRPFVLMIRLFANITAGHIISLAFFSLIFIFGEMNAGLGFGISIVSLAFTIFMGVLELLVAFLQAYVFTLLAAIYFGAAVDEGHDVHNHADDHHHH